MPSHPLKQIVKEVGVSFQGDETASLRTSLSRLRGFNDEGLMAALCNGESDALAILFERHSGLVFGIARAMLRDIGEAEEVVQRVFLDIYRAKNQFRTDRGTFITWLRQYAYHRSIDRRAHLRVNNFYNRAELSDLILAEVSSSWKSAPQETAYLVEQILATLDVRQRKVIELTYFDGLTAVEISNRTGESAPAVRNLLYRGLAKLRNALLETKKAGIAAGHEQVKGMLIEYP